MNDSFARILRALDGREKRSGAAKIVVHKRDRPLERTRQGRLRFYLHDILHRDTALSNWRVFVHEIRARTGRHTHQGGLALFVLQGKGYTICDGRRLDWKAGDLILLPIRPGGVEHQHFNLDARRPAQWVAFLYAPFMEAIGHRIRQHEDVTPGSARSCGRRARVRRRAIPRIAS